jgi:hypothetical protein
MKSGRVKLLVGLPILAAVALLGHYRWANRQPVVNFPPPIPAPSPNGFYLYLAAVNAIDPGKPPVDEIYDTQTFTLTAAQKAERYSPPRRQEWLRRNAPAFTLFQRAQAADSRLPDTQPQNDLMPVFKELRQLARYKVVQAKVFEDQKQWDAAAQARVDILEMANDISRGGGLISSLVAIACEAIALQDFEKLIPHLTFAQCEGLNARFNELASARPKFAEILTNEKYHNQALLLNVWATADSKKKGIFLPSLRALLLSLVSSRQSYVDGNNKMMDGFIAQADKPLKSRKTVEAPNRIFDSLNLILFPVLERGLFKYLPTLPIDPYGSGQTWHYRREGDSYCAWSVGPDGKDDGGKPILPKGHSSRVMIWTDSIGDVVVRT